MFNKYFKKNNIDLLIIVICIIIVSIPSFKLFTLYDGVDLQFHIKRLNGLIESLNNFVFPYRINSLENLGYGGASPIMYPYLFLIILALLYKIVRDYNIVVNVTNILINIMTAGIMFYSSYQIFRKKKVALISTVVFLLSIYRVTLMHGAEAFGEYVAISFIPLVAEGYINILRGQYNKYIDLLLGLTFICGVHTITIFHVAFTLLIISLLLIKRIFNDKKIFISYLKTVILFLLINMWFIVPFLHYYFKEKLIYPVNGFNEAQAGILRISDQIILPFRILIGHFKVVLEENDFRKLGIMSIVIIIFVVYTIFIGTFDSKNDDKEIDEMKICKVFIIIFIVTLLESSGVFTRILLGKIGFIRKFFMLQQIESRAIGRSLPLLYMAFSYLLYKYFRFDDTKVEKKQIVIILGLVLLSLFPIHNLYSYVFSKQSNIQSIDSFVNSDYMLFGTISGEKNIRELVKQTYNCSLPKDIFDGKLRIDDDKLVVTNEKKGYLSYSFNYENLDMKNHYVEVPYFRYIGYKAYNSKMKEINVKYGKNNLVKVNINNQKGKILVKFVELIFWRVSEFILIFTIMIMIILLIIKKLKKV